MQLSRTRNYLAGLLIRLYRDLTIAVGLWLKLFTLRSRIGKNMLLLRRVAVSPEIPK
jgi:hypothetical protein